MGTPTPEVTIPTYERPQGGYASYSPPAAPSALAAAVVGSTVNLSWVSNSSNESGFQLERATLLAGPYAPIATKGPGVTTHADMSRPDGAYFYQVKALRGAQSSDYSSVAPASVAAAIVPVAPSVTASPINSTTIRFTFVGGSGATSWVGYYRTPSGGGTYNPVTLTVGQSSYDVTVSSGSTAQMYVAAANGPNTVNSNVASASAASGAGFTFSAPLTANFSGFSAVGANWQIVDEEGGFARVTYDGAGTTGKQLKYDFPSKTHRELFMQVDLRQGGSEIACAKIFKVFGVRTNSGANYANVTLHGRYTSDDCYGPAYGNAATGANDTQRSARFNGTSVDDGSPTAEYVYARGSDLPLPRGSFGKWRFWWKQNTTPTSFDGECKVWSWNGSAWVLELHRRNLKNRGDDSAPFDYCTLGDYTQSDENFWLEFRAFYISTVGFAS